jgi:hypothetical protein
VVAEGMKSHLVIVTAMFVVLAMGLVAMVAVLLFWKKKK